jgi:dTDP-glucose 4,6-dehydratase
VDDLIDGMIKMMNSPDIFTGPVNLGNPNEFTILQLAELVIALTNSKSKIVQMPLPADDPAQRQPNIDKAREILGWEPKVGRAEGLKITFDYFKTLTAEDLNKVEHNDFTKYNKY